MWCSPPGMCVGFMLALYAVAQLERAVAGEAISYCGCVEDAKPALCLGLIFGAVRLSKPMLQSAFSVVSVMHIADLLARRTAGVRLSWTKIQFVAEQLLASPANWAVLASNLAMAPSVGSPLVVSGALLVGVALLRLSRCWVRTSRLRLLGHAVTMGVALPQCHCNGASVSYCKGPLLTDNLLTSLATELYFASASDHSTLNSSLAALALRLVGTATAATHRATC